MQTSCLKIERLTQIVVDGGAREGEGELGSRMFSKSLELEGSCDGNTVGGTPNVRNRRGKEQSVVVVCCECEGSPDCYMRDSDGDGWPETRDRSDGDVLRKLRGRDSDDSEGKNRCCFGVDTVGPA